MRILPYRGRNDVIDGVLVTFFDITKMVQAEEHQRTLIEELNHRVRNMLTVVSSIAKQTLAKSRSPEEFAATFQGRLQALGTSYSLLSREQWANVPLESILLNELDQHRQEGERRVVLDGPPVALKPAAALALGLVAHELTTNAVKYGALAIPEGRVSVTWQITGGPRRNVALLWQESDGIAVKKPKRKGFGTELIQREVSGTLGGTASFDYAPEGLQARITIPVDSGNVALPEATRPKS
jgi:two-component system CheB/CheR fusion protein